MILKQIFAVLVIILITLNSCQFDDKRTTIRVIDFTSSEWKNTKRKLSHIVKDISYLVLESNRDCYISEISNYLCWGKGNFYTRSLFKRIICLFEKWKFC